MRKVIGLIIVLGVLVACSASNSAVRIAGFGDLEGVESSVSYSATDLQQNLTQQICFDLSLTSSQCTYNLNTLATNSQFNFTMAQISTNATAYKITYTAPGVFGETRTLSGSVIIPNLPNSQIKGIVLYYHGTEDNKMTVPSNFDPNFGGYYSETLAGVFASQGYIVVAPDYIGFGSDNQVLHPYMLYPQTNALDGLYMLRAARTYLNQLGLIDNALALNLYVHGYSEGGSYAMWAAYLAQTSQQGFLAANNLVLKKVAPTSGAYDLLNKQMPFDIANVVVTPAEENIFNAATVEAVAQTKPDLVSYVMTAFATYSLGGESSAYTLLMVPQFFYFSLNNQPTNMYQLYNVLANDPLYTDDYISSIVYAVAQAMVNPTNGQSYAESNNSVLAFIQPTIESNAQFQQALANASLYAWQTQIPICIFYLAQDSLVTNLNAMEAYHDMSNQSPSLVTQVQVNNDDFQVANPNLGGAITPIDHYEAAAEFMVAALNYFNQP